MDHSYETDFNMEDTPLPFYWSPLSLQVIASNKIAVLLWRHRIHYIDPEAGKIITDEWLQNQQFDICDLLPVPFVIGKLIEKSTKQYRSRIIDWVINHAYDLFKICVLHDVIVRFIDFIENIDDKPIARKLLDSDVLNSVEKYRLACKYCWKNDIERLWPSVSNNFYNTAQLFDDPAVFGYWNEMMLGITSTTLTGSSIEFHMISQRSRVNWLADEYFWDKLNAEERSSIVVQVLKREYKSIVTILPKLNKVELNQVLESIPEYIFSTLVTHAAFFEYVIRIWIYFCEFGSLAAVNRTLLRICTMAFEAEKLDSDKGLQVSVVLHEFWIRVPFKLIQGFSTSNLVENFFNSLSDDRVKMIDVAKLYGRDLNFMLDILETREMRVRNKIWRRIWRKLIIQAEPSYLEQFLKLCFDNDDEMIRFKESEMMNYDELEVEFEAFIKAGNSSELMEYVNFCSSNKQRVENLKRRIIALQFRLNKSDLGTFRRTDFDKFIFGTFSNVEFAKKFRAEYVLASENQLLYFLLADLNQGCLECVIKICNYLSYELCPTREKREFLEHCKKYLIKCDIIEFEISQWREFVSSCAGSEENVRVFKESFSVDEVFYNIFGKIVEELGNGNEELISNNAGVSRLPLFDNIYKSFGKVVDKLRISKKQTTYNDVVMSRFILLDNFLFWYFDNAKEVKDYKTTKLRDGRESKVIEMVAGMEGGVFVDHVLKWILDGDTKQIRSFKKNHFQM